MKSNQPPSVKTPTAAQATIPTGAPDAIVVVNVGGEIVLLNVQAEKQSGISIALIGRRRDGGIRDSSVP